MQRRISPKAKAASVSFLPAIIVFALASVTGIQVYENELVNSIREKFNTFYSHAQQDRLYVQTDKTFYKPGETIWFTAYVRDAQTLKPSDNSDIIHIELITPKGTTEKHYKIVAKDGAARGDFDLSGHPGGLYKIKAYTEWQKNEDSTFLFEKEITVQSVVMPRLKMKLDFEKKAYGKGDEVVAKLELNTNADKPLSNTPVKFKAQLDGKDLSANTATTDEAGKVNLRFTLPVDLNTIDGIVNAMIDFEGSTESVSRSIPIVLNKIKLEFFPEGGDLVANYKSRVAFRSTNEFGKPADVEGIVVDSKGALVAQFSSFHFGMGAVDLMPKTNETYRARITKPAGILDEFNLPEVAEAGYVLSVATQSNDAVNLSVQSFQSEELSLIAQTRGKIYYSGSFKAAKGDNALSINTTDFPMGISQITLFDSKGIERCERLVFLHKNKQLKITVSTDKPQYKPREQVNMNIKVTDDRGLPMPGNFSLSVVDDNLLSFADDKQGNILSKVLLEPELKEKVEEPNFYFDAKEPKADKALDLLLMTSGWRHYVWKKIMDGDYPQAKYKGEKAILGGTVYERYSNTPIAGAVIKLKNSGISVITDRNGKYVLTKFNITNDNQVEISASNHISKTQILNNYQNNFDIRLEAKPGETKFKPVNNNLNAVTITSSKSALIDPGQATVGIAAHADAIEGRNGQPIQPKVVGNNAGAAMQMQAAPMALRAKEQQADPVMMDLAQKPADLANAQDVGNIPNADTVAVAFAAIKYNDARAENIMEFHRKAEVPARQIAFYRAKEFPVKKYTQDDSTRNDFASTVYWNGNITTDHTGKAKVSFTTNDLISSFRATLEGFAVDGSVGRAEYNFSTNLPFAMDAKIPVDLVSGDKMMIPVFLKNSTSIAINGKLEISSPKQLHLQSYDESVMLAANSSKVVYITAIATEEIGDGSIDIKFTSEKYNDEITRSISVVAKGFPATISLSGQDLNKEFAINPQNVVPGSMKVSFTAYPNIMSELQSGVASILREPNGCFEQTSSSNYPNILALEYLKSMNINDPETEKKALNLLDKGYKKLTGFETSENGYEWFGKAPAHEALTAYGLMEFQDMKKVYGGVDQQMVTRTADLLFSRRDGEGGFKKNPRALDSFGKADEDVTNAYIVYALSEAGYKDKIKKELDEVYKSAKKSGDPYIMALCANALFNAGDKSRAEEMTTGLLNMRAEVGFWTGKKHSITHSTGESLKVETTSLVLMALMQSQNPDQEAIIHAVKFLVGARSGYGGFGSTQATILALKALTRYAEFSRKTDEAGTVEIIVNGITAGSKDYAKGETSNIIVDGLEKYIGDAPQKIEVHFKSCNQALPYAMNISYSTSAPESSKECVVSIDTKLSSNQAKVGETVRLTADVKNKTSEGQPMTMAIIGLPAGFSAQPWQLKEMQEKGVIDFYEITGNNIAFYYRSLAPNAEKQINLDLKAEIPGEYSAPASSTYLYYTNELKSWVGLDKVSVKGM